MSKKKRNEHSVLSDEEINEIRRRALRKPMPARVYDRLLPGDYTRKQDTKHSIAVIMILAVILSLVLIVIIGTVRNVEKETEATLIIPESSFVQGQESNVVERLKKDGFKNIREDNGSIKAEGTNEAVSAYKESYYDKYVRTTLDSNKNGNKKIKLLSITLSDDATVLTVKVNGRYQLTSQTMKEMLENESVSSCIRTCCTWCAMANDGKTMRTEFSDKDGNVYYTSDKQSASEILAEAEDDSNT